MINQQREISALKARLELKYSDTISPTLTRALSAPPSQAHFQKQSVPALLGKDLKALIGKLSLPLLKTPQGTESPVSLLLLSQFSPVAPEDIYLKLHAFEKSIKQAETDMYFQLREFTFRDDCEVSFLDIQQFAEEMAASIWIKQKIPNRYLQNGEEGLVDSITELIFEVMYPVLFEREQKSLQNQNQALQEKIFQLQNLATPEVLGIKKERFSNNIYQLAFTGRLNSPELRKIGSVKSPLAKCQVILQSINCLNSKLL